MHLTEAMMLGGMQSYVKAFGETITLDFDNSQFETHCIGSSSSEGGSFWPQQGRNLSLR